MSTGLGLLQKLATENRPLSYLEDNDVPVEAFKDDEQAVLEFMTEHYRRHGRMPKLETIAQETDVDMEGYPDEPIGYWTDGTKDRHTEDVILTGYKEAKEHLSSGEMEEAIDRVQSIAMQLSHRASSDRIVTMEEMGPRVVSVHDERQKIYSLSGVPFGFPYLDEISDGAHGGDTVALVGRPGVGKSYFMSRMSNYSYQEHKDIPLVVTMEMSAGQWARRAMALSSGVTSTLIRQGKLSIYGRRVLEAGVESFTNERPYYVLQGSLNSTVEDLGMRVQELRPTVVYIDGAYLMRTKNRNKSKWENVTEIAEFHKMVAKDFDIPVIASWQFNRKGPGSLDNISYSDAIGQLASIVCAIMDEKTGRDVGWEPRVYKFLKLLKGREGEKGTLRILYDMIRMSIVQDSVVSGYDTEGEETAGKGDYDYVNE